MNLFLPFLASPNPVALSFEVELDRREFLVLNPKFELDDFLSRGSRELNAELEELAEAILEVLGRLGELLSFSRKRGTSLWNGGEGGLEGEGGESIIQFELTTPLVRCRLNWQNGRALLNRTCLV